MKTCPRCEVEQKRENAKFCWKCGFKLDNILQKTEDTQQVVENKLQQSFEDYLKEGGIIESESKDKTTKVETDLKPDEVDVLTSQHKDKQDKIDKTSETVTEEVNEEKYIEDEQEIKPPTPLEINFIIANRYKIVETLPSKGNQNRYIVEDNEPYHICWSCGTTENKQGENYCINCGASLSAGKYLVKESASLLNPFLSEEKIIELKIQHPGMVKLFNRFTEDERTYIITEKIDGNYLSELTLPLSPVDVILIATKISEVISYLHNNKLSNIDIFLDTIIKDVENTFKLANFSNIHYFEDEHNEEFKNEKITDIVNLGKLLYKLLTGKDFLDEYIATEKFENEELSGLNSIIISAIHRKYLTIDEFAKDLEKVAKAGVLSKVNPYFKVGKATHIGKVKDLNEDSIAILEFQPIFISQSYPIMLYIVADGMGGHESGEVASRITINTVVEKIITKLHLPLLKDELFPTQEFYVELMKESAISANQKVYENGKAKGSDMGSTLTMALVVGNTAYIANVGDSRVYIRNDKGLHRVTIDHSLVERLVNVGTITDEERYTHPMRNQIYRTMGGKSVEVDTFVQKLKPGDILLLCSDGLWEMVRDPQIDEVLLSIEDPQLASEELVRRANVAGGEDNIAVIIVKLFEVSEEKIAGT